MTDNDTAYEIALTCYHAGSISQRGKTIHPGTVQEWTDRITAHAKKHELQAKKNGFYMAAGLFGADISRVEELWDKCKQELEKYE